MIDRQKELLAENLRLQKEIERISLRNQLTIPKSIADKLDKFIKTDFDEVGHEDWWIQENGLIEWFNKIPNCYIKDAYLAGKALGVDLVEVIE
ncbi:hypothetical protein [Lactococcus lactis]|uniref:hypothetical protein n=1 Tax=Lactococcus lactis TaxID=1358 RepID=UPI0022B89FFC|nr:hypothetical protein [Lactococcus lactis]MCZ8491992.1 hypothetical protein [Lactococcus lactis]